MTAADWAVVVLFTLNALACIGTVGKAREPLEPSTAVVVVMINFALVLWLVSSHGLS